MPEPIPIYTSREEVMFFDTDCAGVVHNLAYLRMIETCRTKLAGAMGMDLRSMTGTGCFPAVVRTEIDYRRPARLGDALVIHGRLDSLQRARFSCSFEMRREGEDALLVTCRQVMAMVALPSGQPQRLDPSWAQRWGELLRVETIQESR
jgi:YbgC/YbaW family acyl-CoA thioester hydrolase